jgi:hypothetical protein
MPKKDPRIDTYIAKSTEFAKPILKHLRETAIGDVDRTDDRGKSQKLEVFAEEELVFPSFKLQSFTTPKTGRLCTNC